MRTDQAYTGTEDGVLAVSLELAAAKWKVALQTGTASSLRCIRPQLPPEMRERLLRECERLALAQQQLAALEKGLR
ncbi:hypothetical protein [Cupriavidus consociatus]|uniref:hypothetical protein n=1 Tax=Cupriavidus consociatus TaxID=2821357 RepID=UPI001FD769E1|nr:MULTISPECIES: hypothetical protein [unclassified Cupriavidus]MDK2660410.1 hypothetical protein [Cupriavidus sp. LEh21]